MRITSTLIIAALAASVPAMPASARNKQTRYEYNGNYYNSYEQCQRAKSKHKRDGTIAGAAIAGVGAALLGANLGETALVAGGGAVVGHEIGRKKRC